MVLGSGSSGSSSCGCICAYLAGPLSPGLLAALQQSAPVASKRPAAGAAPYNTISGNPLISWCTPTGALGGIVSICFYVPHMLASNAGAPVCSPDRPSPLVSGAPTTKATNTSLHDEMTRGILCAQSPPHRVRAAAAGTFCILMVAGTG